MKQTSCPCNKDPKSKKIWYASTELEWDGRTYGDDQLDELQVILDHHKKYGYKSAVIHEGCCHYLYFDTKAVERDLSSKGIDLRRRPLPEETRKCRKCGARLSPFMGKKNWEGRICQNCESLEGMRDDLAKQGLTPLDFM